MAGASGARGMQRQAAWLEPQRLLTAAAGLGWSLLARLDALGARVVQRHELHRKAVAGRTKVSLTTGIVIAGAAVMAGLFAWGVLTTGGGSDQWLTAPGAGNAEAAVTATVSAPPPRTRAVARPAGAPTRATHVVEGPSVTVAGAGGSLPVPVARSATARTAQAAVR